MFRVRAGSLANIIILISRRSRRHITGMLPARFLDSLLRPVIPLLLLGRHIFIKIHGLYHVFQFPRGVLRVFRRVRSMVNYTAVLCRLIQHIIKTAHRLTDRIHHAVRPLYRPVRQRVGVIKRPVREIPDHRQSVGKDIRTVARVIQHLPDLVMHGINVVRQLPHNIFRQIHRYIRLRLSDNTAHILTSIYLSLVCA